MSATENRPRPGAFEVGSLQSRAAARALLGLKIDGAKRLDFVVSVVGRPEIYKRPRIGRWSEGADGTFTRISYIPWGTTLQEAEASA